MMAPGMRLDGACRWGFFSVDAGRVEDPPGRCRPTTGAGPVSAGRGYRAGAFLAGRATTTSISTSIPGAARPATWTAERAGRLGCSAVP